MVYLKYLTIQLQVFIKKLINGKKKKNKYLKLKSRVDHNQLRDLRCLPILKLDRYKGGLIAESRPK